MAEHFRSSLVGEEITWWCKVCKRETRHRLDRVSVDNPGGRLGPCLEHHAQEFTREQKERREKEKREREQPSLFGRQT